MVNALEPPKKGPFHAELVALPTQPWAYENDGEMGQARKKQQTVAQSQAADVRHSEGDRECCLMSSISML
jgi:hypothetical protein